MKTMICAAIVFLVAVGSPLREPLRAQPGEKIPLPRSKSGYSSQPGGASFSRGVGLLEQRKFAEAVTALQAALRRNPRNVDYNLALTHALAGAERPREAWRSFRAAVAIERDHPRLAPALVDVWRAFGRTGLFNVGRSAKDVSAALGKPSRVENHGHQQRWFYEFMAVNISDDEVESVMDVRGLRRESLAEADRLIGGKNDIYRVAYARRTSAISDQQRTQWVKLLRSAELVPVSSG